MKRDKPTPDPKAKQEFEKVLFEGRRLAELVLAHIFNLMYDLPTFQRPSASLLIGVQA